MRSSTIATLALAASTVTPAFAAPIVNNKAREATELERRISFGTAAKSLGSGALTGGALAGLLGLLGLGGSDSAPARRDLSDVEARDLEARLSLGAAAKSLGSGVLTGGAFAGLLGLLGLGGDEAAPARRDLEARQFAGILKSLIGVADDLPIADVIKNAIVGGVASGGANGAVSSIFGREISEEDATTIANLIVMGASEEQDRASSAPQKRQLGKVAGVAVKEGLGSVAIKGLLSGIGSALAGVGIGSLFNRDLSDLTEEQLVQLNALLTATENAPVEARALGGLAKGVIGTGVGLGASLGTGALIDAIKGLFAKRDMTDEDAVAALILMAAAQQQAESTAAPVQARALGGLAKGVIGTGVGLGASLGTGALIDAIKGLFAKREMSDDDAIAALILMAAAQQQAQPATAEKRQLGKVAGVAIKEGLGSVAIKGLLSGIGSALAGAGIGSLFSREFSDADIQRLDEIITSLSTPASLNELD